MVIKIVLLVLVTLAILADAWATFRALKAGRNEGNNWRSFLIKIFGIKGGTYGVAAVLSSGFWLLFYNYPLTPTLIVSLIAVVVIFLFIANSNYNKVK